ncbi:MAG: hypothetical protein OXN25_16270 [Candidatus Poribacteria bacterium]|nr:hypothetical protein [Candidatus Poribacteria bacterium]
MNQKFEISPKFQKWREWMEVIEPEIRLLLRDARVFWEIRIIIHGHRRTQDHHYGYLERSYLDHVLIGLRRQIKSDKEGISFVGLLHEIAKNPEVLPRSSIEAVCSYPSELGNLSSDTGIGAAQVCTQMVVEDITQLISALEACEAFADERLAYLEKHEVKTAPTFKEFKDCFKLLDKTYVKYHELFYGAGLKTLQPPRQAGTLKGLIKIADDFDAELPEFREYMW